MYPVDKYVQKKLQEMASQMRPVFVNTHEKHIMTKAELQEIGHAKADHLQEGATYIYHAPVQIALNHYRALKKAYKKGGLAECKLYIEKINRL